MDLIIDCYFPLLTSPGFILFPSNVAGEYFPPASLSFANLKKIKAVKNIKNENKYKIVLGKLFKNLKLKIFDIVKKIQKHKHAIIKRNLTIERV